jgi:serine/threonine protein kinase
MHYAFQDRDNLFLVMDLLLGGDLRYHIARQRRFTEEQTKFFIACLVQALESVHGCGIIHRDIKPENLVFEQDGYLRLTDFGIARYWSPDNASETSGTPGYMAPEVMCRQNHGVAADYFAVGVIAYECMNGRRPYVGKSRREIRDQILARQVHIKRYEIPEGWSLESADFINKVILFYLTLIVSVTQAIEPLGSQRELGSQSAPLVSDLLLAGPHREAFGGALRPLIAG